MKTGEYTYGEQNITVIDFGEGTELTIGKFCAIAADVTVYLGGNHRTDWITTYPFGHIHQDKFPHHGHGHPATKGNVVIGNDVWIGRGVTIMSGVTIGNGVSIGANSVVTRDVPHFAVVAGNPARIIKQRYWPEAGYGYKLNDIAWWDWPIEKIAENVHLLCSDNIKEFVDKHFIPLIPNE